MLAARGGSAALSGGAALARGGASAAGAASSAYTLGSMGGSGKSGIAGGLGGVAHAGASAAISPLKRGASRATDSLKSSYADGVRGGVAATGGSSTMGTLGGGQPPSPATPTSAEGPPAWAQQRSATAPTPASTLRDRRVTRGGSARNRMGATVSESLMRVILPLSRRLAGLRPGSVPFGRS